MLIKQSETTAARRTVYFTAVQSTDDAAYTGVLSGADIRVSKAGGAEANSLGTATHIATGLFKYELTAGECDTVGEVSIRIAKADIYNDVRTVNVVAFDPYSTSSLGLTNLDATVSSRLADADYEDLTTMLAAADTIETGLPLGDAIRFMVAVLAGVTGGAGTGTETYRAALANHKVRVTTTVVGNNRTVVAFDAT